MLGFQLVLTTLLGAGTVLITVALGEGALMVAVIVLSLPLTAFRTPGGLLLQRDLDYRPLAAVEVVAGLAYYGWAVATVAIGFGVWGFASASIAQAVVGSILMVAVSPMRIVVPTLRWRLVRPLLGFGWRFQAENVVNLTQIQGVNIGVGAVAGLATLGLWTLAFRILRVPYFALRVSVARVLPGHVAIDGDGRVTDAGGAA